MCTKCDGIDRIIHFSNMNSDEDKLYIKIVAIYGIYNFVVEKFFVEIVFRVSKYCLSSWILKFEIFK